MLCTACVLMIKHWFCWKFNSIDICSFISVSGCVGMAPLHYFVWVPIVPIRRPRLRAVLLHFEILAKNVEHWYNGWWQNFTYICPREIKSQLFINNTNCFVWGLNCKWKENFTDSNRQINCVTGILILII
jgi:hypothetical protein